MNPKDVKCPWFQYIKFVIIFPILYVGRFARDPVYKRIYSLENTTQYFTNTRNILIGNYTIYDLKYIRWYGAEDIPTLYAFNCL